MDLKEVMYTDQINRSFPFFLAGDVGGTNCNFGIFSLNPDKQVLVLSLHYKSQKITDFTQFMVDVVEYLKARFALECEALCLGAAGIVYPHRTVARPTNLNVEINLHSLSEALSGKKLFLINDFEAVALGIERIDQESLCLVNKNGVIRKHANKAFIGAGTGLGKSILLWNKELGRYVPVASEGGHADVVLRTEQEYRLGEFIQKTSGPCPVSWEMVLSGAGIQKIYRFLAEQKKYPQTPLSQEIEESGFEPDKISFYAQRDALCKDTFIWYATFYARACKNFALEALALNGIYIAGGIAAKNSYLFLDPLFMKEFTECGKQKKYLEHIPIYVVTDYTISLYGALEAYYLHEQGIL